MLKKLFTAGVVGALAVAALSHTRLGSFAGATFSRLSERAQKAVSPELELERVRFEIARLAHDADAARGEVAEANVGVTLMTRDVQDLRAAVGRETEAARKRGEALKAAKSDAGDQATRELAAEVARLAVRKKTLAAQERVLSRKQATRLVLERHLAALERQRAEMSAAAEDLAAELQLVRLEQAESRLPGDGGRLDEVKRSLAEVRRKLMVQREKLSLAGASEAEPAAGESVDDLLKRLD